jgi:hypothetical protein
MLGKILYLPLYWIGHIWFKISLSQMSVKIWPRNSYYFNRVVPLRSDIDLTLFFDKNLNQDELLKINRSFSLLKRTLPVFSEVNVYDRGSEGLSINPYELKRDQLLEKITCKTSTLFSPADKIVFIQKMLIADKKNLLKNPSSRIKKWKGHFEDCDIESFPEDNFNLEELINVIFKQVFNSWDVNYKKFLLEYLSSSLETNHFYRLHLFDIKYFILTAPAQWIGASIASNQIEQDLKIIKDFSIIEKDVLTKHLKWERWGINTQRHINFNDPTVMPHLHNLNLVNKAINN